MKRINLHKAKTQIARPNTIRDINKQIVLNYVRDRAPISRSEIARETELHRSTVSVITDELLADGLIVEIGAGDSTGGRKPTMLQLKTGTPVAIGIDVTPRTTTVALADLAGNILTKTDFPTSPESRSKATFTRRTLRCQDGKTALSTARAPTPATRSRSIRRNRPKPRRRPFCMRSRRVWDKAGRKPPADRHPAMSSCTAPCARSRSR